MCMQTIFWSSLVALYYVYDGYKRVLQLAALLRPLEKFVDGEMHNLTVLLTVHNEASELKERLHNILNSNYPANKLEVIVASDGSTDGTDEIIKNFGDERVRLFRPELRLGKTETQNLAVQICQGNIIIFTDAGTRFDKKFLSEITVPFSNTKVGAVDGHLQFKIDTMSGVAQGQGYYWGYELCIRQLESQLGILAVSSGACLAVRKELLRRMEPTTGEDCIVPLDVVQHGYKVVHAKNALAYDQMDRDGEKEFKTRVRMTLRNWQGTWSRVELLNPLVNPGYAFALWSHKILRWLSPFFLIMLSLSALVGVFQGEVLMLLAALGLLFFYSAAIFGWWCERKQWHIPLVHVAYSFMLANLGFLVGVFKAVIGRRIYVYR